MLDLRAPLLLCVEVTTACNLKCKYCYAASNQSHPVKTLSLETFNEIIKDAMNIDVFDINICGGEPFLHKDIEKMISIVLASNMGITIVSNGTSISKSLAQSLYTFGIIPYIQISFDGHNSELHNITRGMFDQAFSGFKNLVNAAGNINLSPSVGIVVNKFNYKYIYEIIDFFCQYTKRFHIMKVMKHPELSLNYKETEFFFSEVIPKMKELSRQKNLGISMFDDIYRKLGVMSAEVEQAHIDCLAGYTSLVISADCSVHPCDIVRNRCFGKWSGVGSLTKIYEKSKEQWKNMKFCWCQNEKNVSIDM